MRARVLVVEDDEDVREMVQDILSGADFEVSTRASGQEAVKLLREEGSPEFDVVVSDFALGEMDGVALGQWVRDNRQLPTILLTGHASIDVAVQALRSGVFDFHRKPVEPQVLVHAVERASRFHRLEAQLKLLEDAASGRLDSGIIGDSPALQRSLDIVRRVAPADISVLITGETGTGKELFARAVHAQSERRPGPFVPINCAAIPESLLESELFGHEKGAFTDAGRAKTGLFVQASGGTLFLDEIGEMPLDMQAKLLRALQEQKVRPIGGQKEVPFDARVVAATNVDLEASVEDGEFREDLYYRLNVVHVPLPPLRARGTDPLLLADFFIKKYAESLGRPVVGLAESAATQLLGYDWPGNVRELESAIQRAVAMTRTERIVEDDLPPRVRKRSVKFDNLEQVSPEALPSMEEVERQHIQRVLASTDGNKSRAARVLGFDRRTLYRKLERYGLDSDERAEKG